MTDRQRIGRQNKSRSKAIERDWAHALGTARIGPTGARGPDLRVGPWEIEVKSRLHARLPSLIQEAIRKAAPGQTPVLALTLRNPGHPSDHYVVLRREDFVAW